MVDREWGSKSYTALQRSNHGERAAECKYILTLPLPNTTLRIRRRSVRSEWRKR